MSERCPTCQKWVYGDERHRCQPKFIVWCKDRGEDSVEDGSAYFAFDAECAAEEWAEDFDAGDFTIIGGNSEVVSVQNVQTGEVSRYRVSGETVAQYSAEELTQDEDQ